MSVGNKVLTLLQTARLSALTTGTPTAVTFDAGARRVYMVPGREGVRLPETISFTLTFGSDLSGSPGQGSIVFFGQGNSSGGEIRFADGGDRAAVLSVNWLTGSARLKEVSGP